MGRPRKLEPQDTYLKPASGQTLPDRLVPPSSLKRKDDPASLVLISPKRLRAFIEKIPEEIIDKTETDLRKELRPGDMLCRLRISFWDEYQRAHNTNEEMDLANIIRGCCTEEYFFTYIASKPKALRWIIEVPKDYYLAMREMLDLGLGRLREVLELDFMEDFSKTDKEGNVIQVIKRANPKIMAEIRAVVTLLDQRVKGAIVQRVNIKQESVNVNVDAGKMSEMTLEDLETLEKRLSGMSEQFDKLEKGVILEIGAGSSVSETSVGRSAGDSEEVAISESSEIEDIC